MPELTEIKGVGPVLAKACVDKGFDNVERIAVAVLNDLVAVPGISEARARLVITAAQNLLQNGAAASAEAPSQEPAEPVLTASEDAKPKKRKTKKKKKKDRKKEKDKKKRKKKKNKKDKKS